MVLFLFLYHSIVWPKYHSRIFPQGHSSSGSSRRQAWPERQWLSRKFWVIWSGHHRAQRGHWDWAGMAGLEWFSEWPATMMAFFDIFRRECWVFMGFGPVDLGLLYGDFEKCIKCWIPGKIWEPLRIRSGNPYEKSTRICYGAGCFLILSLSMNWL